MGESQPRLKGNYVTLQVGTLTVTGKETFSVSTSFNNKIGKTSLGIAILLTDDVEHWALEIGRNQEVGYRHHFRIVWESEDSTVQLVLSGDGYVHPYAFPRLGVASITIVDIPHLKKRLVDLLDQS